MIRLPQPSRRTAGAHDDAGFTIVEVVVAIVLVTIVMTSLAAFFVNSAGASDRQGQRQTAIRLAADAIDKGRSLTGVGLLNQRDKATSDAQWKDATTGTKFPGVAAYLKNVTEAYDATTSLPANSGYTASLPTDGNDVTVGGVVYSQNWFLGNCYSGQATTSGNCAATAATGSSRYLLVVVDVTWKHNTCKNQICSYVTATLVSPTPDPLFDASQSAPKPRLTNPGNQLNDVGQSVNLPIVVTGGTAPLTWSATGLPAGLTLVPGSTSTVISGTPTTALAVATPVIVKVVDGFGFVSTAAFTWSIAPRLVFTTPGTQVITVGAAASLDMTTYDTGGTAPYTYSATGLPAGLSINASTGLISGTASTVSGKSVVVSVKDAVNATASTNAFAWNVVAAPTVNQPAGSVAEGSTPSYPVSYSCPNGPCTIALSGSVPGIGLSTAVDLNSDNSAATSLTVPTGSGTFYLTGKVQNTAVASTVVTATVNYTVVVKITDRSSVSASDTETWTARVTPLGTWPGDLTVARGGTPAQAFTYNCNGSCNVTLTGAPAGIGLSYTPVNGTNNTTAGSTSGSGTAYITGKVSNSATLGATTVTLTVVNSGSGNITTFSVGVWTVTS